MKDYFRCLFNLEILLKILGAAEVDAILISRSYSITGLGR